MSALSAVTRSCHTLKKSQDLLYKIRHQPFNDFQRGMLTQISQTELIIRPGPGSSAPSCVAKQSIHSVSKPQELASSFAKNQGLI